MKQSLCWMALIVMLLSVPNVYSQVSPGTVYYFSQVAAGVSAGSEFGTLYFLVNPGSSAAQVTMEFYGDNGSPLALQLENAVTDASFGTVSTLTLTLGPGATTAIAAGVDGPLKTGWAKVSSSIAIWPSSMFQTSSVANGDDLSQVGVAPATPQQTSTIMVVRAVEPGEPLTDTGVALVNPSDAAAIITATLFDATGAQVAQQQISLPARGHVARFAGELFTNLPPGLFLGKMVLTSPTAFTMMNLFISGQMMTSFPVFRN